MKSTIVERRRARGLLVALGCVSVMAAFMACSGGATKRTTRGNDHYDAGGDSAQAAGAGGAPQTEQGGSASTVTAGGTGDAGAGAQAGEPHGGAAGASGAGGETGGGATGGMATEGGAGGESSVGGEGGASSVGGEGGASSIGGEGGASVAGGGAGGEGGQAPFVDPVCGVNMAQVGAYSLWCGKVNMHLSDEGAWTHDADCSSGCNVTGVGYCQKFYPTATAVVTVPQLETKDWKNAGCADSTPDGAGISGEAACCAPAP